MLFDGRLTAFQCFSSGVSLTGIVIEVRSDTEVVARVFRQILLAHCRALQCARHHAPASICEEEDTCMSYKEEDTCMSHEEEDTCMSYEEEDICMSPRTSVCSTPHSSLYLCACACACMPVCVSVRVCVCAQTQTLSYTHGPQDRHQSASVQKRIGNLEHMYLCIYTHTHTYTRMYHTYI